MSGTDSAMLGPAVRVDQLTRDYSIRHAPPKRALDGVSFEFGAGQVFSIVGPNGAGKTTLIKILMTLLAPTSGAVQIVGFDVVRRPRSVRPLIGSVLAGSGGLIPRASARENLRFSAALYRITRRDAARRCDDLLDRFGLTESRNLPVNRFSTGMRQRLLLARALLHDPAVLLLDEPTNGLDPQASADFRRLVADLRASGKAVLFCSHNMSEVAALSDQVTILHSGRVIASGTPSDIARQADGLVTVALDVPAAHAGRVPEIIALPDVLTHSRTEDESRIRVRLLTDRPNAVEKQAADILGGDTVAGVFREPATLEDAYLHLVQADRRGDG